MKLEYTLALWPLPENFQQTAQFYRESLADVPPDLVDRALRHVRLNSKWFPKPSELREPILSELLERHATLARLAREARDHQPDDREAPTPDRVAEVHKLVQQAKRNLLGNPDDAA